MSWTGGPWELLPALPQDEAMTRLVAGYAKSLERYRTEIVGRHSVRMPRHRAGTRRRNPYARQDVGPHHHRNLRARR